MSEFQTIPSFGQWESRSLYQTFLLPRACAVDYQMLEETYYAKCDEPEVYDIVAENGQDAADSAFYSDDVSLVFDNGSAADELANFDKESMTIGLHAGSASKLSGEQRIAIRSCDTSTEVLFETSLVVNVGLCPSPPKDGAMMGAQVGLWFALVALMSFAI